MTKASNSWRIFLRVHQFWKLQTQRNNLWCVLMHEIKDLKEFLCNPTTWYAMSQESWRSIEKNYDTHDLELATIIHDLKMWRHYLMGRKFELRTYHCGMKYLFDQPTLNARTARWLELLSEFDFEIKHIKWKENKVADALSRKVHEMHVASLSTSQPDLR